MFGTMPRFPGCYEAAVLNRIDNDIGLAARREAFAPRNRWPHVSPLASKISGDDESAGGCKSPANRHRKDSPMACRPSRTNPRQRMNAGGDNRVLITLLVEYIHRRATL